MQVNQANALAVKTLPYLIGESMRACDTELRQVLMANIVLTGGGSLFSGLAERLHAEMQRQYPHVCPSFSVIFPQAHCCIVRSRFTRLETPWREGLEHG